ncbi:MAG: glycosyltransferase family 39 protein [Bacteroidetes bacterium]|nr:MAG: glycosyltransferase family 39 protein [Bacteroidota bacterium]
MLEKLGIEKFRDWQFVLLVVVLVSLFNWNKAYHIDDTFHLEAAAHLRSNPAKSMSAEINWGDTPTPMYHHNQPPLYFYLLALVSRLFGEDEQVLHLVTLGFVWMGLHFFWYLMTELEVRRKRFLLVLLAFCPAFIVNQNLMVDIPLLAMMLGCIYFLIRYRKTDQGKNLLWSGLLLGAGVLTKYTLIPLIPCFFLLAWWWRKPKVLIGALIPIVLLLLWSWWNWIEFGAIHLFGRSRSNFNWDAPLSFIIALGAISSFLPAMLNGFFGWRWLRWVSYVLSGLFVLLVFAFGMDWIDERVTTPILIGCYALAGGIICLLLIGIVTLKLREKRLLFLRTGEMALLLPLAALSSFLILYAPFQATRHILLLLPFILLISHHLLDRLNSGIRNLSVGITLVLGTWLGISDWFYADYYRQMAREMYPMQTEQRVFSAGHWGWQWYSRKEGMKTYALNESILVRGDYLIHPDDVAQQRLNDTLELELKAQCWHEASWTTWFSGKDYASMYNSYSDRPPWVLSKKPIDTIRIFRLEHGGESKEVMIQKLMERIRKDEQWMEAEKKKAKSQGEKLERVLREDAEWLFWEQ